MRAIALLCLGYTFGSAVRIIVTSDPTTLSTWWLISVVIACLVGTIGETVTRKSV